MKVTTKKYRMEKNDYIRLAFKNILRQQWWVGLIAVAICLGSLWVFSIWWYIGAVVALGLYLLFWWLQFYGVTQLDQGKMLFERYHYEITSQEIKMMINPREGMPLKWDQIKSAQVGKDHFLLFINKAQLIYWPFKIFNTENEKKFVQSVLKTKRLTQ
jgi:hypothetical protein